jgi:hypothetical protein
MNSRASGSYRPAISVEEQEKEKTTINTLM